MMIAQIENAIKVLAEKIAGNVRPSDASIYAGVILTLVNSLTELESCTDSAGVELIIQKLSNLETNLGDLIMATVQQLEEAIAAEKVEVTTKIDALAAEIVALKDQIAQGGTITEEQLDAVLFGVQNIFTPV
jgi:hypothetical protein